MLNEEEAETTQSEQQSIQQIQVIDIIRDANANMELETKSANLDSASSEKKLAMLALLKAKKQE